jgi:phosphohistidine phosphatase
MSKRLYLLRHAKSSRKQPELADHERPLTGRGRRAASAIARHLREHDVTPELVLCSTARRARETLERLEPALGTAAVRHEPQLYRASADVLLERLHSVPDDVASVMLIGHNPAIEQLALDLASVARAARARGQVPDRGARDARVSGPELGRHRARRRRARQPRTTTRPRDLTQRQHNVASIPRDALLVVARSGSGPRT